MNRLSSNTEARIKALEGRLQQYPSSAAFFPLASLLWEKGEAAQAEHLLKSGLATYPNYAAAGVLLGEILISKNEHEQAARFIAKALEIAPWNILGQRLFAKLYRNKGDEEAAQVALRAATLFKADYATPQRVVVDTNVDNAPDVGPDGELGEVVTPALAELYMAQGHLDKAQAVYERLLESDPAKVEWNERLAVIREQLSQDMDVDAPKGYNGAKKNLDLIAGEEKDQAVATDEAIPDAPTPDEMEADEGGAEASSADFEYPSEDLTLSDEVAGVEKEKRESSVSPAEDVAREKVVDPVLQQMIELYVKEKNDSQALDMCRKAQILGHGTPWIFEKRSILERRLEESVTMLLRKEEGEDKEHATPVMSRTDQIVVDSLEGWLKTLQRRKENA